MDLPSTLFDLPRTLLGAHVLLVRLARADAASGRIAELSLLERIQRLEAEQDIRTVINQYAYCYDDGDIDGLMEIYSPECRLINNVGTFVGTTAIRANYVDNISEREVGYHHVDDVQVVFDDPGTMAWASGFLYNVALRDGQATGTMANCLFHLARGDGGWLVIESRITVSNRHRFLPRDAKIRPVPSYATSSRSVSDLLEEKKVTR